MSAQAVVLKSREEVYHIFSHGWASREGGGLVTRCGQNDLTLEVVGVKPIPRYATRCARCFGYGPHGEGQCTT